MPRGHPLGTGLDSVADCTNAVADTVLNKHQLSLANLQFINSASRLDCITHLLRALQPTLRISIVFVYIALKLICPLLDTPVTGTNNSSHNHDLPCCRNLSSIRLCLRIECAPHIDLLYGMVAGE